MIITLLTDFGTADGYVGEMKGVLLSRAPGATLVDITHDIAAQDVDAGRLAIARMWHRFPLGTVHLAVVDPGVGSARRAIAVMSEGRMLVGPDNGLLSPALLRPDAHVVELSVPADASPTFHGRDVFAPAAAELAMGAKLETLGASVADAVVRRTPASRRFADGTIEGEVITVDRFGNAVTNLMALGDRLVEVADRTLDLRHTYADVAAGEIVAVVGSTGLVEIAQANGSAAKELGLRKGSVVVLRSR